MLFSLCVCSSSPTPKTPQMEAGSTAVEAVANSTTQPARKGRPRQVQPEDAAQAIAPRLCLSHLQQWLPLWTRRRAFAPPDDPDGLGISCMAMDVIEEIQDFHTAAEYALRLWPPYWEGWVPSFRNDFYNGLLEVPGDVQQ